MAALTGSYFSYSSWISIGVVLSFGSPPYLPLTKCSNVCLGNKKISRVSARKDKFNPTFLHQATEFFIFLAF